MCRKVTFIKLKFFRIERRRNRPHVIYIRLNWNTDIWLFFLPNATCLLEKEKYKFLQSLVWHIISYSGADSGGRSPKIGKNVIFFGVKSWFFTRNTSKISRLPRQLKKIWFFGVKSWFFTRNTPKISCLPLLGAIFLSAPPLTWNPGSAPE
jgi:hypothetical protein